mgnify:FL=1|jgi:hypothetical protein
MVTAELIASSKVKSSIFLVRAEDSGQIGAVQAESKSYLLTLAL